jgi:hypothetical protein
MAVYSIGTAEGIVYPGGSLFQYDTEAATLEGCDIVPAAANHISVADLRVCLRVLRVCSYLGHTVS